MNMKLQMLNCILTAILSSSTITPSSVAIPAVKNSEYLPITSYQQSLSEMISNYIMSLLYEKDQTHPIAVVTEEKISELSPRDAALETMKSITTKIFDINDTDYLSTHLLAMKQLSEDLHPEDDLKTINAIHCLLENQHRSNAVDKLFWAGANYKHKFNTTIPVTEETKAKNDKIETLFKKMAAETKKRNEEAKARA